MLIHGSGNIARADREIIKSLGTKLGAKVRVDASNTKGLFLKGKLWAIAR